MARLLSTNEHARIAAAIRAAETRTSGEIYCVVARSSDSYFYAAALFALAGTLLASLAVAFLLEVWWVSLRLPVFVAAQILAALAVLLVLWLVPALRLAFVPPRLRYRRAHDNALRQFLARNVHITTARTGVLIFVSLAERYAEIVADSGIDSAVEQEVWNGLVADLVAQARKDRLADGFVEAITVVGAMLEHHFPRGVDDRNELDDHVVEI